MITRVLILIMAAVVLWGCSGEGDGRFSAGDSIRVELLKHADSLEKVIKVEPASYSKYISAKSAPYSELVKEFGEAKADVILKLNRIDKNHLKAGDTIVIPDSLQNNFNYYSPFPLSLKGAARIPKILFISQEIQAFAGYEYGVLVRWGPTSTGKPSTPTPNGLFHTNWKAVETISTSNDEWLLKWNFNIENLDGIAIHEYDMPGRPASHSCARVLEEDGKWFYNWAEQWILSPSEDKVIAHGTPVIIFGEYDFEVGRPWKKLADDPESNYISRGELEEILEEHLHEIEQKRDERILAEK